MSFLNNNFRWALLLLMAPTLDRTILHRPHSPAEAVLQQRLPVGIPEEMTLPLDLQVSWLFRSLTFDIYHEVEFKQAGYRIGIIYAPDATSSLDVQMAFVQYLAKYPSKQPLTFMTIPFNSMDQFRESIRMNRINVAYICPGNTRNLDGIVQVSKDLHVITATGVEKYVKEGVALGLVGVHERDSIRPRYSVNRLSAKFDPDFLDQAFKTYP